MPQADLRIARAKPNGLLSIGYRLVKTAKSDFGLASGCVKLGGIWIGRQTIVSNLSRLDSRNSSCVDAFFGLYLANHRVRARLRGRPDRRSFLRSRSPAGIPAVEIVDLIDLGINGHSTQTGRGKPRDEDTEGGNQPADKSLINRRLSLRSQLCAAKAFLACAGGE